MYLMEVLMRYRMGKFLSHDPFPLGGACDRYEYGSITLNEHGLVKEFQVGVDVHVVEPDNPAERRQ